MNHPSKNMASLAELVGADDEAAVLCAALAKAITRLEKKRDEYDVTAAELSNKLSGESDDRVTELHRLGEEVDGLRRTTERTVEERDQVIRALRSLVEASTAPSNRGLMDFESGPFIQAQREARELLELIDQTTGARGEPKLADNSPATSPPTNSATSPPTSPATDAAEQGESTGEWTPPVG